MFFSRGTFRDIFERYAAPNPLTPEVLAAFLAELRRGTLVVAAAARVGVPLQTLYNRRKRDPVLDLAWSAAARLSRGAGSKRRVRFGEDDKSRFLATLPGDCDTKAAAGRIGFHRCTIYRHLRRDPAFARSNEAALSGGIDRLFRAWEATAAERSARLRARLEPLDADLRGDDDDSLTRRLDRYTRPDGSIGVRRQRPSARHVCTFERAMVELDRKLDALGLRRIPFPADEAGD